MWDFRTCFFPLPVQFYALYWKTVCYWLKQWSCSQEKRSIGTHCLCADQYLTSLIHTHFIKTDFHIEEGLKKKKSVCFSLSEIYGDFSKVQYRQMLCKLSWAALGKLFILYLWLTCCWYPQSTGHVCDFCRGLGSEWGQYREKAVAAMNLNLVSRDLAPELQHHCAKQICFPHKFFLNHAGCKVSLVHMFFHSDIIFSDSPGTWAILLGPSARV